MVADQIRTLSEETRQSTEKISKIVQELGLHAQEATDIVATSIEAMNKQNGMVETVADNFGAVRDNIDVTKTYYIVIDTYSSLYSYNHATEIARYDHVTFARDLLAKYIENGGMAS